MNKIEEIDNISSKISDDFKNSEIKKVIDELKTDSEKAKEEIEAEIEKINQKF